MYFLSVLILITTAFLQAAGADEEQTKVQFVDGNPVAPAHSMFDDIQTILEDDEQSPSLGEEEGEMNGGTLLMGNETEISREKRWFQATCAHGVCHIVGAGEDPFGGKKQNNGKKRQNPQPQRRQNPLPAVSKPIYKNNRPAVSRGNYGYNRPKYGYNRRPNYGYNRHSYGYNRSTTKKQNYGYNRRYGYGRK